MRMKHAIFCEFPLKTKIHLKSEASPSELRPLAKRLFHLRSSYATSILPRRFTHQAANAFCCLSGGLFVPFLPQIPQAERLPAARSGQQAPLPQPIGRDIHQKFP